MRARRIAGVLLLAAVAASILPAHAQAPDPPTLALQELTQSARLHGVNQLVLGPAAADAFPAGTVIEARYTGRVSTEFAIAAPAAAERPMGRGSTTVVANQPTSLSIRLNARAREGLAIGKKLKGTISLTASSENHNWTAKHTRTVPPPPPPRCFGAASRDPRKPCHNAKLTRQVLPPPFDALLSPNSFCRRRIMNDIPWCAFGKDEPDINDARVALVGDSHAAHWRAAVEVVARRMNWSAASSMFSGCPLNFATRMLPARRLPGCRRWNRSVIAWLRAHPTVHTLIVSNNAGSDWVAADGLSKRETAIRGYRRAWNAVPRSVKRIVVIRDVPGRPSTALGCIEQARVQRANAGRRCAWLRREALNSDEAVVAARRSSADRVRVLDLTPFFCDARVCFPVVGGALVHKDEGHITEIFSATLGPFLLRGLNAVAASTSQHHTEIAGERDR